MSDWKDTLHIEHEDLMAEVPVDLFGKHALVPVLFEGVTELTPLAEAALNSLLQRLPSLEAIIVDTAFEHYQRVAEGFKTIYGRPLDMPVVTNAAALLPYYHPYSIYLPEEPELGRFGIGFGCEWEEEHGFGIQFRNWHIVEIGGDAEAFSFYD